MGCCIDREVYCLQNYLQGSCQDKSGTFVSKRCDDVLFCAYGSDKPLIQKNKTIFPYKELAASFAPRGNKGSFIPLVYFIAEQGVERVQAQIQKDGETIALIEMYDDGRHNDGSAGDGLYGAMWDSSFANVEDGVTLLSTAIILTINDEARKIPGTQTISIHQNNACFSLGYDPSPSLSKNVIILGSGYGNSLGSLRKDSEDTALFLRAAVPGLRENDGASMFRLNRNAQDESLGSIASLVSAECPFFSPSRDSVILLDKEEECRQENWMITMTPDFTFRASILNLTDPSLSGFCGHVVSQKKLFDDINKSITPPQIVLYGSSSVLTGIDSINISFSILDFAYPARFIAYRDGVSFTNGSAIDDFPITLEIPLNESRHEIAIQAINSRSIYSYAIINITRTQIEFGMNESLGQNETVQ